MPDYIPRTFTYRPLSVVEDADQISALGFDPDMISANLPEAIVVLIVELGTPSPTIYPNVAAFEARFKLPDIPAE